MKILPKFCNRLSDIAKIIIVGKGLEVLLKDLKMVAQLWGQLFGTRECLKNRQIDNYFIVVFYYHHNFIIL